MTREEMIIEFYSNGEIPFIIKLFDWLRGEIHEYRRDRRLDRASRDWIFNNSNSNTRTNIMFKMVANGKIRW